MEQTTAPAYQEHLQPDRLERYSFIWSEARLAIAAVALLLGGVPVLRFIIRVPGLYGLVGTVLLLSWLLSGVASVYLAWRWRAAGWKLFGGQDRKDIAAFIVSIVSGINLGLTGLLGSNIGMSISSNYIVFIIVAVIYLASAAYLYKRWSAAGQRLFA